MKKLLCALTVAGAVMVGNFAAAADGLYVGASLTGFVMDSDRFISDDDDSLVGGLSLGYRFSNDWALELNAGTEIADHEMDVLQANFYYYFGEEDGSWRPYVLAGISYFDQEDSLATLKLDEEETHQAQIGVGLANMLSDHWEVKGDIRLYHKIREGQSGTNDGALNLAVNYYFSTPAPAAPAAEPARVAEPARQVEPAMRTITIRLNVEFEFDKDIVRAIYGDELTAVANAMKEHDDILLVLEGHTDARGADEYNQGLSARRAAAVKAKLVGDYGIPAGRVSSVGYGESHPIADNASDEGRARNRRVIGEMSYSEVVVD